MSKLTIEEWTQRAKVHLNLIAPFSDAFIQRRSLRKKHAVHDFLFTYYSFSPTKLKQWVPSIAEEIEFNDQLQFEFPWLKNPFFKYENNKLFLKPPPYKKQFIELVEFIICLCRNISERTSRFGCFGLHEWAMVYKQSKNEIRHENYSLRLEPSEIEKVVKSQNLCCTHYDAYRFFTKEASPLNVFKPDLSTRLEMEQGGCIHANMDLYKWSAKLWPWIGSDFIRKTFFHALHGRELDMRASPYDLKNEGYFPILIETEEGRKQYQTEQQIYSAQSQILRKELLQFCEKLLTHVTQNLNK